MAKYKLTWTQEVEYEKVIEIDDADILAMLEEDGIEPADPVAVDDWITEYIQTDGGSEGFFDTYDAEDVTMWDSTQDEEATCLTPFSPYPPEIEGQEALDV